MKNIWFINQYITSPEMCGASHRHFSLSKYLVKYNKITLFTGSYSHLHENKTETEIVEEQGVKIVNLSICKYKKTLTRIINFFHFVFKLRSFDYKKMEKPDIIVISTMSLFPLLLINFYKKKFRGVKIVHEVRDVWPLTPIMLGGRSTKHPFIKMLDYCQKLGYKNADYFVSNLEHVDKHIKKIVPQRSEIPFTWISNGVDVQEESEKLSENVIRKLPKDKFLVGYAGSIGIANAMATVIEAFNKLRSEDICLCLVGDGEQREELEQKSSENVIFLGRIPKCQVNDFLSRMDVCVLSWQNIKLYEYGISPNKIFDYMNAEKPVVMSGNIKKSIIDKAKCGWVVPAEDSVELATLLLGILKLDKIELKEYGENGKKYLDSHFTYSTLALRYQKEVFENV